MKKIIKKIANYMLIVFLIGATYNTAMFINKQSKLKNHTLCVIKYQERIDIVNNYCNQFLK